MERSIEEFCTFCYATVLLLAIYQRVTHYDIDSVASLKTTPELTLSIRLAEIALQHSSFTHTGTLYGMPDIKTLLIQISVILITSYSVGWLLSKVHQPQVIGEMVAGVLLGPSLLGWVAPDLSAALFPPESLALLYSLSQVGLLLFMFMVGLELNTKKLYELGRVAVVISHTSINRG